MNKKLKKLIEPGLRLYLAVLLAFAVATLFFNRTLAIVEACLIVVLAVYSIIRLRRRQEKLLSYIDSVTYNAESAKDNTLMNFPLPMAVFRLSDGQVIWGNEDFFSIFEKRSTRFEVSMSELIPNFTAKWLTEGHNQYPELMELGGRKYQVHGNLVRTGSDGSGSFMGITYWLDVTDYENVRLEFQASRPVVCIIAVDNFEELAKNLSNRMRDDLRADIEDKLSQWVEGKDGFFCRGERDRYIFIFEERYLAEMTAKKFDVMDHVRQIISPAGVHATLSIGIGREGSGFEENYAFASLAFQMALSRGGDQTVIKKRYNFEFFGGKSSAVETRTKVKARVTAHTLSRLVEDSSCVYVMGHRFGDLDTVGSAAGICCIARSIGTPVHIVIDPIQNASRKLIELLRTAPEYRGVFLTPKDALMQADSRSLLIVVDTNRPENVESPELLEACNRVVVIDHHRRAASYIQNAALEFHETSASSASELTTELIIELLDAGSILRVEAEAMLAGIVLDTKNFSIRTGEHTFDAAAFLRRVGADTSEVKKLLQNDMAHTVAKYAILQQARLYRDRIAISAPEAPQDRIVAAQAADELLNVAGVDASFVAYPTADGVSISARSIGDVNVQVIMETLGGGGNRGAAAVQLHDVNLRDAINRLLTSIDEYLATV